MKSYVVFNRKGEILLAHTEMALEGEPQRIDKQRLLELAVARVDEKLDESQLDVLEVEQEVLQRATTTDVDLYVDTQKRTIGHRDRPKATKSK